MCAHPFSMRPVDVRSMTTVEFDRFAATIDKLLISAEKGRQKRG